jgi:hypothetical protein
MYIWGAMKRLPRVLLGLAALAGAARPILMQTAASTDQITAYVSHHASSGNADSSCATAKYTTINGAIHPVVAGGTVVVCPGHVPHRPCTQAGAPGGAGTR